MLDPAGFREVVSGRKQGVAACAARAVLRAAELPYTLAVNWRNRRYDSERAAVRRAAVPVVSIGNLTLGGTGKTPFVRWLAEWCLARALRPAIVSRGYGAARGRPNDEAMELHQALPDVPHLQNPNRAIAAERAVEEFAADVIILDDGFQHRRLARDLDIVLIDALEPFGFEHVFPRGTLREPLSGLRRANIVCLSRADTIADHQREQIRQRAAHIAPNALWCELAHAPVALVNSAGDRRPLNTLAARPVGAFCGIGNPSAFQRTLDATGCRPIAWRTFPDHHAYSQSDLDALTVWLAESQPELAICTQKDLVKIAQARLGGVPLWALAIEMRFLAGQAAFEEALARQLPPNEATSNRTPNTGAIQR